MGCYRWSAGRSHSDKRPYLPNYCAWCRISGWLQKRLHPRSACYRRSGRQSRSQQCTRSMRASWTCNWLPGPRWWGPGGLAVVSQLARPRKRRLGQMHRRVPGQAEPRRERCPDWFGRSRALRLLAPGRYSPAPAGSRPSGSSSAGCNANRAYCRSCPAALSARSIPPPPARRPGLPARSSRRCPWCWLHRRR